MWPIGDTGIFAYNMARLEDKNGKEKPSHSVESYTLPPPFVQGARGRLSCIAYGAITAQKQRSRRTQCTNKSLNVWLKEEKPRAGKTSWLLSTNFHTGRSSDARIVLISA